jgi:hypothetical protein
VKNNDFCTGFCLIYHVIVGSVIEAFTCSLMLAVSARADMLTKTANKAFIVPKNKRYLNKSFRLWLRNHQRYLK